MSLSGWRVFSRILDEAFVAAMEAILTLNPGQKEFPVIYSNVQGKIELIKQFYDLEAQVFSFDLDEKVQEEKAGVAEERLLYRLRNMFFRVIHGSKPF